MNQSATPGPRGTGRAIIESSRQRLDPTDTAILAAIADFYRAADPLPDGLIDRLKFGVALDEVMAEVAQLTRTPIDAAGVRSETSATRTASITFSADQLTAMVTVQRAGVGRVRVEGWIAPPSQMKVRLRMQGERLQATADANGRFAFDDVPEGFAQLTFHTGGDETDAVVVTPLFEL
jgi:hypothetical protein